MGLIIYLQWLWSGCTCPCVQWEEDASCTSKFTRVKIVLTSSIVYFGACLFFTLESPIFFNGLKIFYILNNTNICDYTLVVKVLQLIINIYVHTCLCILLIHRFMVTTRKPLKVKSAMNSVSYFTLTVTTSKISTRGRWNGGLWTLVMSYRVSRIQHPKRLLISGRGHA